MSGLRFAPTEPPRGILRLAGEDRAKFLQGLVSNDIFSVDDKHGAWTALLTPQGKYLFDFFVVSESDALLLDGEGERISDLRRRLSIFRLRSRVVLGDASAEFEVWHGWGDKAAAAAGLTEPGTARQIDGALVLADPRLPALGIRLIAPRGQGNAILTGLGFNPAAWAEWDGLRLSLGVPDGSRDLTVEKSLLLESGFDELNGVSWSKGCYMGQELTARTRYRGLIKKRLMPVRVDGTLPPSGTMVTGLDGSEAGEIRSGSGKAALALIRLDAIGPDMELTAGSARIEPFRPDWARW